jgi:hypothetical protein
VCFAESEKDKVFAPSEKDKACLSEKGKVFAEKCDLEPARLPTFTDYKRYVSGTDECG